MKIPWESYIEHINMAERVERLSSIDIAVYEKDISIDTRPSYGGIVHEIDSATHVDNR